MGYKLVYTKQTIKDAKILKKSGLDNKAKELLEILKRNPFETPPSYEKLIGDLKGAYSRRINIHNRLVYEVLKNTMEEKDENDILKMIYYMRA